MVGTNSKWSTSHEERCPVQGWALSKGGCCPRVGAVQGWALSLYFTYEVQLNRGNIGNVPTLAVAPAGPALFVYFTHILIGQYRSW
jgi:hypothetical protein